MFLKHLQLFYLQLLTKLHFPLPAEVLESLRKIPEGCQSLLSRPVDLETVERTASSWAECLLYIIKNTVVLDRVVH